MPSSDTHTHTHTHTHTPHTARCSQSSAVHKYDKQNISILYKSSKSTFLSISLFLPIITFSPLSHTPLSLYPSLPPFSLLSLSLFLFLYSLPFSLPLSLFCPSLSLSPPSIQYSLSPPLSHSLSPSSILSSFSLSLSLSPFSVPLSLFFSSLYPIFSLPSLISFSLSFSLSSLYPIFLLSFSLSPLYYLHFQQSGEPTSVLHVGNLLYGSSAVCQFWPSSPIDSAENLPPATVSFFCEEGRRRKLQQDF